MPVSENDEKIKSLVVYVKKIPPEYEEKVLTVGLRRSDHPIVAELGATSLRAATSATIGIRSYHSPCLNGLLMAVMVFVLYGIQI